MTRYWVGGSGNWTDTSHWASSSGGSGGSSVPTSTDDVVLDSHSGSATITSNDTSSGNCQNLTCTGFTGALTLGAGKGIFPHGNVVLAAGMTIGSTFLISLNATGSLTTNGCVMGQVGTIQASVVVTLQDNLSCSSILLGGGSTFDANGHNVTCLSVIGVQSIVTTTFNLYMGSGTWSITGSGNVFGDGSGNSMSVSASTSTLKLTNTSSSTKTVTGTFTLHNFWITGTGTGGYTFTDSCTFADFKDDNSAAHAIKFKSGRTYTVSTWHVSGAGGNKIALQSSSAGTAWNLACASGAVTSDLVSLQDSHASGGATFTATNATNVSGNTGWLFPGLGGGGKMFALFCWGAAIAGFGLPALGALHGLLAVAAANNNRTRRRAA